MRCSVDSYVLRSTAIVTLTLASILASNITVRAATLTVCASGCAYSDFQLALEAAQPGDTILLRAGETFVGNFVLPLKTGGSAQPILIRSDASDSSLPAAGTRLVPNGYAGGNTDRRLLARLRGPGGIPKVFPIVQAEPGASGYRLQFLDIDGIAMEGWETIVELGNNGAQQSTLASVPSAIVLDRVFVHGHPTKGQKRCVALNGRDLALLDSFVVDCKRWGIEAQAVAGFNGPGPFRIINNHLEGATENIMFGGATPRITGLVPADIEIRRNHLVKPLAWRDPILSAPSAAPGATVNAGAGALAAGTHYFIVIAAMQSGGDVAVSARSPERAVSVSGAGSAVTLTWTAVPGAEWYRVYRGTSPGVHTRYFETTGAVTSLIYRGTGELSGTSPKTGTRWNVKNLLELKSARRVVIEGNVLEHNWLASQTGYAVLLTPRNADGAAPWTIVADVTIANNVIRHVAGGISILGEDDVFPSQRTAGITIRNNLAYDVSPTWDGASHFFLTSRGPIDLKIDHNTIFQTGMILLAGDGSITGFEYTNNVAPHNDYGIFGSGAGSGVHALATYFPGAVVRRNAFGGGPASVYPPDNLFPDMTTFNAQFVNAAADDYRLVAGSIFRNAGTDGKDIGVDFAALNAVVSGVVTGAGSSGEPGGGDPGGGGDGGGTVSGPFGGTALALPGVLQVEAFDNGGSGVAYVDTSAGNTGGQYRSTDVDIESTADAGGGYNLGWVSAGERLNYTVNVAAAGTYTLEFRVAALAAGGRFHLEVNGVDRTGPIAVPGTGGWQTWTTIAKSGLSLAAGPQLWTLVMDAEGGGSAVGNFNYIRVTAASPAASGPFGTAPVALPGTLEAEHFDRGGQGIAYRDTTAGNVGGQFRSTDVDISTCTDVGGGYRLGWIAAGEWLHYTVAVAASGMYDVEARVASQGAGGRFHIEVEGVDKTGPMTIPDSGGWHTYTTIRVRGVSLSAGTQVWRLVMDANGPTGAVGNINWLRVMAGTAAGGSTPYGGAAATLPATFQAENFDSGGEGIAYHDLTVGNEGGQYRTTNVDIAAAADAGGGYTLGWVGAGEWLKYTVTVAAGGTYTLEIRVASDGVGGTFHIEVDGVDKTGPLSVPNTGGWQTWATIRKTGVSLSGGPQIWRIVMDRNGAAGAVANVNYIRVVQ